MLLRDLHCKLNARCMHAAYIVRNYGIYDCSNSQAALTSAVADVTHYMVSTFLTSSSNSSLHSSTMFDCMALHLGCSSNSNSGATTAV
jgi:hypothetical protein